MTHQEELSSLLRRATRTVHAQLESRPAFAGFSQGACDPDALRRLVGGQLAFWRRLEALRPAAADVLTSLHPAFGPWAALPAQIAAAAAFAAPEWAWPDPPPPPLAGDWLDGPSAWAGAVYVREGAAHGGRLLASLLEDRADCAAAVAFLRRDGTEPPPWAALQAALEAGRRAALIDPDAAIRGAVAAFEQITAWYDWLDAHQPAASLPLAPRP